MPSSTRQIPPRYSLTVAEYHRIADAGIFATSTRTELIDGEIIEMVPIGTLHAGITKRLINAFAPLEEGLLRQSTSGARQRVATCQDRRYDVGV